MTVQFMSSGPPADLFNSSEYTLREVPHQQNQTSDLPAAQGVPSHREQVLGPPGGILECIMYDQIPVFFAAQPPRFNTRVSLCFLAD